MKWSTLAIGFAIGYYALYVRARRAFGQPWATALNPKDILK